MNMRNDIHTALRSLFAGTAVSLQESNPTEESSGIQRLLLGKVLRLTGDEHALIQVGDQAIQGKLETKLRPQAYYWFSYEKNQQNKWAGSKSSNVLNKIRQQFRKRQESS